MFRSRNGRFALSKTGVIAFILETNAPSVAIVNKTEVPIVDLAAENLAISVANMIESLLELSTALGDERSPSAKGGPSDPKTTEFLPPILPHELVQLSGSEFASLLRMYSPIARTFLSEEDIVMMDQELQALRRAAVRESILSAALAKCNADTPFQEAWAWTEHRFKLLESFAGVCFLAPRSLLMAVPVIWLYVEVK
ncbi:hypothetical protein KXD40_005647 [Peronospora effusa]|uniref:Uncharacterized protein n=1 Tax=Peronospora effusa TaxID=542832 RepID=A0A3M6VFJ2_9STRA|nr:hypothetical protein DD238_006110 [Peronospora effusa]RQM14716.1 hypothetical protein DD237_006491 [Peronospora effusa]UIZ27274.1 hypothetical protein KXD40_005647 [Peronospora effusa]CAI5727630.1 unnamed protein product [Peronospora effusa]